MISRQLLGYERNDCGGNQLRVLALVWLLLLVQRKYETIQYSVRYHMSRLALLCATALYILKTYEILQTFQVYIYNSTDLTRRRLLTGAQGAWFGVCRQKCWCWLRQDQAWWQQHLTSMLIWSRVLAQHRRGCDRCPFCFCHVLSLFGSEDFNHWVSRLWINPNCLGWLAFRIRNLPTSSFCQLIMDNSALVFLLVEGSISITTNPRFRLCNWQVRHIFAEGLSCRVWWEVLSSCATILWDFLQRKKWSCPGIRT